MIILNRLRFYLVPLLIALLAGCAAKKEPPPPPTVEELYDSLSCMWDSAVELMFVYEIASILHDGFVKGEDVLWKGDKHEIMNYLSKKMSERGDKKDDALYQFGDCLYQAIRSFR